MLHKDGTMHFSNLKYFAQSPAHYAVSCDAGFSDTTSYRIGRAIHAWWLKKQEPVFYDGDRRGKAWEDFKEFQMTEKGVSPSDILNRTEFLTVQGSVNALNKHSMANELLGKCTSIEERIEWERDGIPCSGTPDAFGPEILLELKSCECAKPRKFLWDAHKYSYHAQLPWYDIGLGTEYIVGATNWRKQYIIAVETKPPFAVVIYELDPLRIDQGNLLIETWLADYKECAATGIYPSYKVEEPVRWDGEITIAEEDEE